jgi:hypothetical protein
MTCSRCSLCLGARTSSFTSSDARRCCHARAGTRRPSTDTSNPPRTRTSTRVTHQGCSPQCPQARMRAPRRRHAGNAGPRVASRSHFRCKDGGQPQRSATRSQMSAPGTAKPRGPAPLCQADCTLALGHRTSPRFAVVATTHALRCECERLASRASDDRNGRGASAPAGPSSPGALHRRSVGSSDQPRRVPRHGVPLPLPPATDTEACRRESAASREDEQSSGRVGRDERCLCSRQAAPRRVELDTPPLPGPGAA